MSTQAQRVTTDRLTGQDLAQAINQHAHVLDDHSTLIENHAGALDHIQGYLTKFSHAQHWDFGVGIAVIFLISLGGILWMNHLQARIKKLEAINPPRAPAS